MTQWQKMFQALNRVLIAFWTISLVLTLANHEWLWAIVSIFFLATDILEEFYWRSRERESNQSSGGGFSGFNS